MMNRFLTYPLLTMMIMTLVIIVFSGSLGNPHYVNVVTPQSGELDVGLNDVINFLSPVGVIGIVATAVGLTIMGSVNIFGSGINIMGTRMIFNALIWFGLWFLMFGITYDVILNNILFILLWVSLSMI